MQLAHLAPAFSILFATAAIAAAPTTRPASPNDRVEQLIEQLGAPDFRERAAAAAQLRKLGRSALPALRNIQHADPEVVSWCAALAEQIDPAHRPELAQTPNRILGWKDINRIVESEAQIEIPARQLRERHARRLNELEAEIRQLRQRLEEPVQLRPSTRLVRPRQVVPPAAREKPEAE